MAAKFVQSEVVSANVRRHDITWPLSRANECRLAYATHPAHSFGRRISYLEIALLRAEYCGVDVAQHTSAWNYMELIPTLDWTRGVGLATIPL